MAVGHTGHEEPQPQPLGAAGDETERGVALQHGSLGRRPVHLEEVVHEREGAHADGLGALGEGSHARSDTGGTAGPVEPRDVEIELHAHRSTREIATAKKCSGCRAGVVVRV